LNGWPPDGADVVATSPGPPGQHTILETTTLSVSGGAFENRQPLALLITRNANTGADTLPVNAFLHLVEIRYTATG